MYKCVCVCVGLCVAIRSFRSKQSWALSVLFNFFLIKNDFLHFYQVNLTGFLNRTGAEIGY